MKLLPVKRGAIDTKQRRQGDWLFVFGGGYKTPSNNATSSFLARKSQRKYNKTVQVRIQPLFVCLQPESQQIKKYAQWIFECSSKPNLTHVICNLASRRRQSPFSRCLEFLPNPIFHFHPSCRSSVAHLLIFSHKSGGVSLVWCTHIFQLCTFLFTCGRTEGTDRF